MTPRIALLALSVPECTLFEVLRTVHINDFGERCLIVETPVGSNGGACKYMNIEQIVFFGRAIHAHDADTRHF